MALHDVTFKAEFGVKDWGKNATEAVCNLGDSLPSEVSEAIEVLSSSGWVDVSWVVKPVDYDEFKTNFLRAKPGEESV